MLLNIAVANGPALTSIRLQGTPNVTDAGLCTLISTAPNLKLFSIVDAGQGVIGHFVPSLLQHCKQLETLLIEGAESMDWATLRLSGAWASAMAAAAAPTPAPAIQADAVAPTARSSTNSTHVEGAGTHAHQQPRQLQECASAGVAAPAMPSVAPARRLQRACFSMRDSGGGSGTDNDNSGGSSSRTGDGRRSSSSGSGSLGQASSGTHGTQAQASSLQAGAGSSQQQLQQRQRVELAHAPRVSSSSSCSGHSEFSSCQEGEGAVSDDSSSSSNGSIDARSDSTSFSMPAQAVEALAQQLQQILSTHEHPTAAATSAAAAGQDAGDRSSSDLRAQHSADAGSSSRQQQQQRRRRGASGPRHAALRRLRVRLANVDTLQQLLECVPGLTELQLDGPALSIQAAAVMCPGLRRLSYLVCSPAEVDAALLCLSSMRNLRALELEVKGMVLSTEQLRVRFIYDRWCCCNSTSQLLQASQTPAAVQRRRCRLFVFSQTSASVTAYHVRVAGGAHAFINVPAAVSAAVAAGDWSVAAA